MRDSAVSENKMATKLPNGERPVALQPASGCRLLRNWLGIRWNVFKKVLENYRKLPCYYFNSEGLKSTVICSFRLSFFLYYKSNKSNSFISLLFHIFHFLNCPLISFLSSLLFYFVFLYSYSFPSFLSSPNIISFVDLSFLHSLVFPFLSCSFFSFFIHILTASSFLLFSHPCSFIYILPFLFFRFSFTTSILIHFLWPTSSLYFSVAHLTTLPIAHIM